MTQVLLDTGSKAIVKVGEWNTFSVERFVPKHTKLITRSKVGGRTQIRAQKDLLLVVEGLYQGTDPRGAENIFFIRRVRQDRSRKNPRKLASLVSFCCNFIEDPTLIAHLKSHPDQYPKYNVWSKIWNTVLLYDDEVAVYKKGTDFVWVLRKEEYREICESLATLAT
jgi:hypothetical protein